VTTKVTPRSAEAGGNECRTYGAQGCFGQGSQPLRAGLTCAAPLALRECSWVTSTIEAYATARLGRRALQEPVHGSGEKVQR
jgi:hypothetical protein